MILQLGLMLDISLQHFVHNLCIIHNGSYHCVALTHIRNTLHYSLYKEHYRYTMNTMHILPFFPFWFLHWTLCLRSNKAPRNWNTFLRSAGQSRWNELERDQIHNRSIIRISLSYRSYPTDRRRLVYCRSLPTNCGETDFADYSPADSLLMGFLAQRQARRRPDFVHTLAIRSLRPV